MDKKDVKYIADLAKLHLNEVEIENYAQQLGVILGYMEKLNELDTSHVEPTSYILDSHNVFRKDRVKPSLDIKEVLNNAPSQEKNYFKVPKVVEE